MSRSISLFAAGVISILAMVVPAAALAHDEATSTVEGHAEEDAVALSPAEERRLDRRTTAATAADADAAAATVTGNEDQVGQWGPVVDWPVVAIHAALLENGKVLAYDSVGDNATETYPVHDHTRATVWDPVTGTQTPVTVTTGYNIFCSGLAHLMDGSVFVAGGNKNAQLDGIVQTHIFDPKTNTWSLGPNMANERWYPSVTPLRNGEMLITEGGPDTPEVRKTDGGLRALSSASLDLPLYPWMDVAPDGRAFYSGPDQTMRSLDTAGGGTWQTFGQRDTLNRDYGSHAMFDLGKILVAGGGDSSRDARVIDLNGANPQVSATAPMAYGRRQHNLTVLADGTVLATGGNSSGASLVDLDHGVYPAELWNPVTGQWRTLAAMQVTRQYHSTALLLPDGRVLSAGGGVCGTCDEVGYLAKNAEVFSPPYLFKKDGSGELAPRPEITSAPDEMTYGAPFAFSRPERGLDQQGGAGPAWRRHPLGEHGATLRAALVHRRRRGDQRHRPGHRQRDAAGDLHALRGQLGWRSVGREDDAGRQRAHHGDHQRSERRDQRPDADLQLLLPAGDELRVQARLGLLRGLRLAEDHVPSRRRLSHLLRSREGCGRERRSDAGLPILHGQDGRCQRLRLDPHGHGGLGGQGQPGDHPSLRLDPASHGSRRWRLHGLGRPRGHGMRPKRRPDG